MNDQETKRKTGRITVTIQREDRLRAISDLCEAIKITARALNTAPAVTVANCVLDGTGATGILIDSADQVTRTQVIEFPNDLQNHGSEIV